MSGKKGSNSSLNVLEEKVIGNLMDCSKASIEFKGHGHRRAHSYGSQGYNNKPSISYSFVIRISNRCPCKMQYNSISNKSPYRIQCNSSSNRSPYRIQYNSISNKSPYRIQCNSSSNRSPYRIQCNSSSNRSPYKIQCYIGLFYRDGVSRNVQS